MPFALRLFLLVFPLALASPATAHPHVFIEAGLHVAVDANGKATGVTVTWEYDELYSLVSFEDLGLDSDYDGQLTPEELEQLDGFDLKWIDGYDGDLYLSTAAGPVAMGPPEGRGVTVVEGRIRSSHFRPLLHPVSARNLTLRVYDPGFYTAYGLGLGITVDGDCKAGVIAADHDKADARLKSLLAARAPDEFEMDFPAVGEAYADTVAIQCAG